MIEQLTQAEIREVCAIFRKAVPTDAEIERLRILTQKWDAAKEQHRHCRCGLPWKRCQGHGRATP